MTEFNAHETQIYPNLNLVPLNAVSLNDQNILLQRLKKEN